MFETNFDFDYNRFKLNAVIDCFDHEEEKLRMELINHMEKLYDELDNNIKATSGTIGNTYYVFSSGRDKESIYKELDLTADRADEISRSVIETAYGRLCAEQRPSVPENKPYANRGIAEKFMTDSVRT